MKPKIAKEWSTWFFHESMAHLSKVDKTLFYKIAYHGNYDQDYFAMYQMGGEL